jgi:dihydrofolate reductase
MRKLVLGVAVSLDGFIEGPNGEYDWCIPPPANEFNEFFKRFDTIFVGRKTYEMSLGVEAPKGFPKFKEYVFSTTLNKVKEGAILIRNNVETEVEKIKKQKGKDIWLFGGAGLTTSLLNLGLVDELSLGLCPVVLGSGKPLFSKIQDRKYFKLVDAKTYPTGLVSLNYTLRRVRK